MHYVENLGFCLNCGSPLTSDAVHELATAADCSGNKLPDFRIMSCKKCGLGFTSPIPTKDTAAGLYEDASSSNFDAEGGSFVGIFKDILARRFIKSLLPMTDKPRVLDFSTGNGRYALAAAKVGAAVVATDYQRRTPDRLANIQNVTYYFVEDFEQISPTENFDLIILRHVLEHSYDPKGLISLLSNHLATNGVLYIEVPNVRCAWAFLAGKYWPGYYPPFHVSHFDKLTLASLIEASGLRSTVTTVHMPMMGNLFSRRWGIKERFYIKLLGIALFPIQGIIEIIAQEKTAVSALVTRVSEK